VLQDDKNHEKEDDMDVSALTGAVSGASQGSTTKLAENFDTFLTLLTAQLKNQDPLEPLKTNEFTQQLVQFSSVEQAIAQNRNLESLVALTQASVTGSAVGYLGREVTADGDTTLLQNGEATWSYNVARAADTVTLAITDAGGGVVHSTAGETGAGTHQFNWDGTGFGGLQLPDGAYSMSIIARDTAGNTITTETRVTGRVSAIDFSSTEPTLTVGGVVVRLGDVQTLSEPAPEA